MVRRPNENNELSARYKAKRNILFYLSSFLMKFFVWRGCIITP